MRGGDFRAACNVLYMRSERLCTWLAIVIVSSSHMEAPHLARIAGKHVLQAALSQQPLKLCMMGNRMGCISQQ